MTSNDGYAARWSGNELILLVRVQAHANRNQIMGVKDARLRIRTTAAPTDGKANRAVIRLLAEYLQVPPSRISFTHGGTHRNKRLCVEGPVSVPVGLPVAGQAPNSL